MANAKKHSDPLPDEFGSYEEAAQFWDTHSVTDYEESLEPVDLDADIRRRHFEIEVDEESFLAVRETAPDTVSFSSAIHQTITRQTEGPFERLLLSLQK